jgi:hypothetical protein
MKTRCDAKMALTVVFTVAVGSAPVGAMPTYEFLNREKYTSNGIGGALQVSLRMEALRSAYAKQNDRGACIINNFATRENFDPPGYTALVKNISDPGHLEVPIETAILNIINSFCGSPDLPHTEVSPVGSLTAEIFFDLYKVPFDKRLVIETAISTQIARITQSGNQAYAQCLQTNFGVDDNTKVAPEGFSTIVKRLIANKAASSEEPVEHTILATITDPKFCGPENTPIVAKPSP